MIYPPKKQPYYEMLSVDKVVIKPQLSGLGKFCCKARNAITYFVQCMFFVFLLKVIPDFLQTQN